MSDWFVELLQGQAIQGIAALLGIVVILLQLAKVFVKKDFIEWLPEILKNRIVTHLAFLFMGIVFGLSFPPRSIPDPSEAFRTYEWQWAGENWYGRLTLEDNDGKSVITKAKVGIIGKDAKTDQIWLDRKVLELVENQKGAFEITSGGLKITELRILKKNRRTGEVVEEKITGTLPRAVCFAGQATYSSVKGSYKGDMVLVGHRPYRPTFDVDDWFENPTPAWVIY